MSAEQAPNNENPDARPHLLHSGLEARPWLAQEVENPAMARLLRAMLEHRHDILRWYPWVSLATRKDQKPAPVAALLLLWERWDETRGLCPRCGEWALATQIGGGFSGGLILGFCTLCALRVSRHTGGIARITKQIAWCLQDSPYRLPLQGWPAGWCIDRIPDALVAALEEVGADGLREDPA